MELNDEQLNNVTGGGSGNIPSGGITYSTYSTARGNRYYAKNIGDTDLIYTYINASGYACYYLEKLTVNIQANTWSTERVGQLPGPPASLYKEYPYVLNIKQ